MNKKTFALTLQMLISNFGLTLNPKNKEGKAHMKLIFDMLELKGFTDQDFQKAVGSIILNEASLFGKMPTVAMFLKHAGKQELTIEQQAKIEADKIINHLSQFFYTDDVRDCVFDNAATNTAVNKFGGLLQIFKQLYSEKGNRSFLKKDLAETWINYYNSKHHDEICRGSTDFTYGISESGSGCFRHREQEIHFIGEKTEIKTIEQTKQTKTDGTNEVLNDFINGK